MRRFLLSAVVVLFASTAFAQHPFTPRSHVWLYRSPNSSTPSWGYDSPTLSYQSGYSPRQERVFGYQSAWSAPSYPVYTAPAYGSWQGSYYWNWRY